MVDKTIPDLDPVVTPAPTDRLGVRQAGDTEDKRETRLQLHTLQPGELFTGTLATAAALLNVAPTAVVPSWVPNKADADTGVGWISADYFALIAGAQNALGLREIATGVVQSPKATLGITANPGGGQGGAVALIDSYNEIDVCATFNDSVRLPDVFAVNSLIVVKNNGALRLGIFPAVGDNLGEGVDTLLSLPAGSSIAFIATVADSTWTSLVDGGAATALLGLNNNGPQIADIAPTDVIPNLLPNKTDANTGIGWQGSDIWNFITGGIQSLQFRELANGVVQAPSASLAVGAFAGGGQGSATPLIDSYNVIITVATDGDSVRLPSIFSVNALVYIKNDDSAQAADVFPASGDNLGAGVDTAVSLPSGESLTFIATGANSTWTQLIVAPGPAPFVDPNEFSSITADNVSQTQASGTPIVSRLTTLISLNAADSATLPAVFAVNTLIEINMPDVDDDDATAVIFPALGDDLGLGVNAGYTIQPHENVVFRATVADSTWERAPRAANSVRSIEADGGMVREITSEEDEPTLCPRSSQPGDGIGSGNPGEVGFVANRIRSVKYVNNGTGVLEVQPDRSKAVTAFATGGQTNAVELLETYNVVTVVASAGDSVKLGLVFPLNAIVHVTNRDSTEAMDLFPGLGDDLGQGTNIALSVLAGTTVKFIAIAANATWHQFNEV